MREMAIAINPIARKLKESKITVTEMGVQREVAYYHSSVITKLNKSEFLDMMILLCCYKEVIFPINKANEF